MKINPIMLVIAILISALIGYGFFAANTGKECVWILTCGSFLSMVVTLGTLFSVSIKTDSRLSVNIKILAGVFFVAVLIEQLVFAFVSRFISIAPYIIVTGILLLVFVTICYAISKSN